MNVQQIMEGVISMQIVSIHKEVFLVDVIKGTLGMGLIVVVKIFIIFFFFSVQFHQNCNK